MGGKQERQNKWLYHSHKSQWLLVLIPLSLLSDLQVAHCQQVGCKRDAGDPRLQLQQSLLQQVRFGCSLEITLFMANRILIMNSLWLSLVFLSQALTNSPWHTACVSQLKQRKHYGPWEPVLNWLNCVSNKLPTTQLVTSMSEFHIRRRAGCNETAPYCSPSVVAAFVTPHTTNNHDGKRLLFCKTQKTAGPSLNMSDSTLTLSVEAVVDKLSSSSSSLSLWTYPTYPCRAVVTKVGSGSPQRARSICWRTQLNFLYL